MVFRSYPISKIYAITHNQTFSLFYGMMVREKRFGKTRNAENLDKSKLSAEFLASQRGFEPPAYRLGEAPIRHQEVLYSAKKSRNFKAFSLFHIS